jgi:hypothetical protein
MSNFAALVTLTGATGRRQASSCLPIAPNNLLSGFAQPVRDTAVEAADSVECRIPVFEWLTSATHSGLCLGLRWVWRDADWKWQ